MFLHLVRWNGLLDIHVPSYVFRGGHQGETFFVQPAPPSSHSAFPARTVIRVAPYDGWFCAAVAAFRLKKSDTSGTGGRTGAGFFDAAPLGTFAVEHGTGSARRLCLSCVLTVCTPGVCVLSYCI